MKKKSWNNFRDNCKICYLLPRLWDSKTFQSCFFLWTKEKNGTVCIAKKGTLSTKLYLTSFGAETAFALVIKPHRICFWQNSLDLIKNPIWKLHRKWLLYCFIFAKKEKKQLHLEERNEKNMLMMIYIFFMELHFLALVAKFIVLYIYWWCKKYHLSVIFF